MSTNLPAPAPDTAASDSALTLAPPPVGPVANADAAAMVRIDPSTATRIDCGAATPPTWT